MRLVSSEAACLLAILVSVIFPIIGESRASEPIYQGKSASHWVKDLEAADFHTRFKAEEAVSELGTEALPELMKRLADLVRDQHKNETAPVTAKTESALGKGVITATGDLEEDARGAIPHLQTLLNNPDSRIRGASFVALMQVARQDESVISNLLVRLRNEKDHFKALFFLSLTQTEDLPRWLYPKLRTEYAFCEGADEKMGLLLALGGQMPVDKESVVFIKSIIQKREAESSAIAVSTLAGIFWGFKDPWIYPVSQRKLGDPVTGLQQGFGGLAEEAKSLMREELTHDVTRGARAISFLLQTGVPRDSLPAILDWEDKFSFRHNPQGLSSQVLLAFAAVEPVHPKDLAKVDLVADMLKSNDEQDVCAALVALPHFGNLAKPSRGAIEALIEHQSLSVRFQAVDSLAALQSDNEKLHAILAHWLAGPGQGSKLAAINLIRSYKGFDGRYTKSLRNLKRDKRERLRKAANRALEVSLPKRQVK